MNKKDKNNNSFMIRKMQTDFIEGLKQGGILQFLQKGNPIRVPKNLKTVKTIKINNGTLTGKIDKNNNVYWFRNDKYITPNQMKTYKYYDSKIGAYRRLGNRDEYVRKLNKDLIDTLDTLATPVITPNIDKLTKFWKTNIENKTEEDYRQSIPFNGEHITLRTKGNMNLTDVPINLLDSIAINSGRSNTNFWKNAALIGKESTFGGYSKYLGRPIYPETKFTPESLTSNHVYFLNEYDDYLTELEKKYNYYDVLDDNSRIKAEENAKYALEHKLIKDRNPHYSNYVLADAFKRYTSNPARYNPGLKNYVPMINNIELELKEEKQLQNYWNTRGKEFYNKGLEERINAMKKGGILDFLKNGGQVRKMQTAAGGPLRPTSYLDSFEPEWKKEYKKGIQRIPEITVTGKKRYIMSEDPNHQLGFIDAVTGGGLKRLSLTQNARVVYDAGKALAGKMSFTDWTKSLIEGNNGIVSDEFAEEHPYISTGINLVGDAVTFGKVASNLSKTPGTYYHGSPTKGLTTLEPRNGLLWVTDSKSGATLYGGGITGRGSLYKMNDIDLGDNVLTVNGKFHSPFKVPLKDLPENVLNYLPKGKHAYIDRIADAAREAGYSSVLFKNVLDFGGKGASMNPFHSYTYKQTAVFSPVNTTSESVSPISKILGLKQGGKMNLIDFLKKGSGIHIKKENRGKFTDYCGGKVTDECIRKAKASGNPTLVKRATFALNSRRWSKHKNGGSIKTANARKWKHLKGGILLFLLQGGNTANLLSGITSTAMNAYSAILAQKAANLKIESLDKSLEVNQKDLLNKYLLEELERINNETLPDGVHASPIYNRYIAELRALKRVLADLLKMKYLNEFDKANILAEATLKTNDAIAGGLLTLGGIAINYFTNKSSKNTPPSTNTSYVLPKLTTSTWTPSTTLSTNLGYYSTPLTDPNKFWNINKA